MNKKSKKRIIIFIRSYFVGQNIMCHAISTLATKACQINRKAV